MSGTNEFVRQCHKLPIPLHKRLKITSAQTGISMAEIISKGIEMYLDTIKQIDAKK